METLELSVTDLKRLSQLVHNHSARLNCLSPMQNVHNINELEVLATKLHKLRDADRKRPEKIDLTIVN